MFTFNALTFCLLLPCYLIIVTAVMDVSQHSEKPYDLPLVKFLVMVFAPVVLIIIVLSKGE